MLSGKIKSAIMTILSLGCILFLVSPAVSQSGSGGGMDLKGTDSKGSYSYDGGQTQKGSSVGHGFMHRKSEGSRSKSSGPGSSMDYPQHISGKKSHKTYSHGGSGYGYSQKKSEGSKSKSYSHEKSGHGVRHHKAEGSYSKSYRHGKSSGHGKHGKDPFRHVLCFKKKLGLTEEQVKKIKDLSFEYKKVRIRAEADHQIAHLEMDRQVHAETVDERKIRAAAQKIVEAKAKKIMAMAEGKIKLLNLLTAKQRKIMSEKHSR
ncbi:hypothetical protein UR09_03705 [Candidatus Nitromaritima sp. SCGC AAA799-A02]|nr:hypothetical protein UR09_03705 [Candidatus Nitromaritima sp. SCGC AAA799-A02]